MALRFKKSFNPPLDMLGMPWEVIQLCINKARERVGADDYVTRLRALVETALPSQLEAHEDTWRHMFSEAPDDPETEEGWQAAMAYYESGVPEVLKHLEPPTFTQQNEYLNAYIVQRAFNLAEQAMPSILSVGAYGMEYTPGRGVFPTAYGWELLEGNLFGSFPWSVATACFREDVSRPPVLPYGFITWAIGSLDPVAITRRTAQRFMGTCIAKCYVNGWTDPVSDPEPNEDPCEPGFRLVPAYGCVGNSLWRMADAPVSVPDSYYLQSLNLVTGPLCKGATFALSSSSATLLSTGAMYSLIETFAEPWFWCTLADHVPAPSKRASSEVARLWNQWMFPRLEDFADNWYMYCLDPTMILRLGLSELGRWVRSWFDSDPVYRLRGYGLGGMQTKHDFEDDGQFSAEKVAKLTREGWATHQEDMIPPVTAVRDYDVSNILDYVPFGADTRLLCKDTEEPAFAASEWTISRLDMRSYGWYATPFIMQACGGTSLPPATIAARNTFSPALLGNNDSRIGYSQHWCVPTCGYPPSFRHVVVQLYDAGTKIINRNRPAKDQNSVGQYATITGRDARLPGVGLQGVSFRRWGSGTYDLITTSLSFRESDGAPITSLHVDNGYKPVLVQHDVEEIRKMRS